MNQYKEALRSILYRGTWQANRTGIDSIKNPYPIVMNFDMEEGFPIITGRKAAPKSSFAELVGFLRGATSAKEFRDLGCKFWDQNANENAQWLANAFRKGEDDLGDVYGAQWRRWPAFKLIREDSMGNAQHDQLLANGWKHLDQVVGEDAEYHALYTKEIDQLGDCIHTLIKNPNDRRILFHAWNPAKLDEIALPACHLLYQFVPCGKDLSLSLTIRSNDMPLGAPANIIEAAALLHLVARLTGYNPRYLTTISNDAHIYKNQLDMVNEYLDRPMHALPTLVIADHVPTYAQLQDNLAGQMHEPWYEDSLAKMAVGWLDHVEPTDFSLPDYTFGESISAPMAV